MSVQNLFEELKRIYYNDCYIFFFSAEDVKKTWQHLRDSFRREIRKVRKASSDSYNVSVKWPYYKQLLFLGEAGTSATSDEVVVADEYYENADDNEDNKNSFLCDIGLFSKNQTTKRKMTNDDAVDGEKRRIKVIKHRSQLKSDTIIKDDDYHFVLSIIPYLRKLPEERKLGVRMSIMGTIEQELEMCRNGHFSLSSSQLMQNSSDNHSPIPGSPSSLVRHTSPPLSPSQNTYIPPEGILQVDLHLQSESSQEEVESTSDITNLPERL